jgi:hypothetical protein
MPLLVQHEGERRGSLFISSSIYASMLLSVSFFCCSDATTRSRKHGVHEMHIEHCFFSYAFIEISRMPVIATARHERACGCWDLGGVRMNNNGPVAKSLRFRWNGTVRATCTSTAQPARSLLVHARSDACRVPMQDINECCEEKPQQTAPNTEKDLSSSPGQHTHAWSLLPTPKACVPSIRMHHC